MTCGMLHLNAVAGLEHLLLKSPWFYSRWR